MSDTEQKTPNKTGASGATWTEAEKIAYLIVLCGNDGKIDAKIAAAPIPAGRSIISCRKLLVRLKDKYKPDIESIKAGVPLTAADGDATATPDKPKSTPRKRKAKTETEDGEGTPTKKAAGGRKKKGDASPVKEDTKMEDVKEENFEDEA